MVCFMSRRSLGRTRGRMDGGGVRCYLDESGRAVGGADGGRIDSRKQEYHNKEGISKSVSKAYDEENKTNYTPCVCLCLHANE